MTTRTITFDDEQWRVVPREPTEDMLLRGYSALMAWDARTGDDYGIREVFLAMLAAAPEPPAQQPPEPAAYMYQHDETGRTTFREADDRMNERRWEEFPLYRHPASEQQPMSDEQIVNACYTYRHDFGLLPKLAQHLLIAEARRWADAFGIGKGESNAD